tara:strand:+ start:629 stop:1165 length:537 start_codon:yes stop_codon:yes gene_type:complete
MSRAFDAGWAVVKAPWYYHATPEENLHGKGGILHEGIKSNFGEVYASKDPEIARRWVSFGRMGSPKIATVPFWRDEGDPRMKPGMDHSPMMLAILGMNPDEVSADASWVSNENIPPEDILPHMLPSGTPSNEDKSAGSPGITVYDNPMYNEAFAEQMRIVQEANQKLLDEMGDNPDEQ